MDEHTTYDPASALADAAQSRNALADRLITPWWYHPVIGVPLGAMFALMDAPFPARIASVVVACAALGWAVAQYRRQTGLWVGPRETGPRSRPAWIACATVLGLLMVAVIANLWVWHLPYLGVVCGVLVALVYVVGGRITDDALRADIRAGQDRIAR